MKAQGNVFGSSLAGRLALGFFLGFVVLAYPEYRPSSEIDRSPPVPASPLQPSIETTYLIEAHEEPQMKPPKALPAKESVPVKRQPAAQSPPPETETTSVAEIHPASQEQEPVMPQETPKEYKSILGVDFWLWAGIGANYTSNSQTVDGFSDVKYGRIKAPSSFFQGGFFVSERLGLDLSYKSTPGEAKSSADITVVNGEYNWQTITAEGLWRSDSELTDDSEIIWRLGIQHHQIPFMVPLGSSQIEVKQYTLTNISLGFDYRWAFDEKMRIEWMMRYQRPVGLTGDSGTSLEMQPQFSFDGSLGAVREIKEDFFAGVYFYGQYQNLEFSYSDSNGTRFSGKQSLLFSNVELRLGFEF